MNNSKKKNNASEASELKKVIASQKTEIFQLKNILANVPGDVYWKNKDGVWLGLNVTASENLRKMGFIWKMEDVIGKTDYEIFSKKTADIFRKNDLEIMQQKIEATREEEAVLPSGEKIIQLSTKRPLTNETGETIGIVGITINITAEKEAERLKIENEKHKQSLQDQEKFTKIANQVAHDIRSPLASLLMIVKSCTEIPEAERIALREAAINIGDIANNLLSRYASKSSEHSSEFEASQSMLVSATLLQLLADKKYEYQNLTIKLDHEFSQTGHFAFIKISPSDFKRMVSNLINNAKDAFNPSEKKQRKILVSLDANNEWVTITIQDNGKGMSPKLIEKIKQNIAVTEGKKEGYGIGLTQVRETLLRYQGEISITSQLNQGTKVILTFPRIKAPSWIGEEIKLRNQDTIVILDDDTSIHTAWNAHFDSILKSSADIKIKHFHQGNETLDFLNSLSTEEKEKIFLLTDFELLKQELNGLSVIEQSQIKRSLLVTSHYMNPDVREQAAKTGTKILPKQLSSEIHIAIDANFTIQNKKEIVDLVIVDDDEVFTNNLSCFIFRDLNVDCYQDPRNFLENLTKYDKDTKIFLDYNFTTCNISGIELAKKLHTRGYTNLYLISGNVFDKNDIPSYLTVVRKDDIKNLKN